MLFQQLCDACISDSNVLSVFSTAVTGTSVDEHAFPLTGFLWLGSAVRYIWWQRWDDDNCQNGVALPM